MRKIFYLFITAFAAMSLAVSCELPDNGGNDDEGGDNGDDNAAWGIPENALTTITDDNSSRFIDYDAVWRLEQQHDGTYTLFMDKTRFVEMMPMLDMEVRGLVDSSNTDNPYPNLDVVFYCAKESTIPYFNNTEYARYEITDLKCLKYRDYFGEKIDITFKCAGYYVNYNRADMPKK